MRNAWMALKFTLRSCLPWKEPTGYISAMPSLRNYVRGALLALTALTFLPRPSETVRAAPIDAPASKAAPPAAREFRGVWVATVANIDWPSQPGLPTAVQKQELIAIMDRAAALNFNAVVLQVRPAADAIYASPLEPWSEYVTGEMGRPPEPFYDPLEFAVKQAHLRGLELHAWFNPYRAWHPTAKSKPSASHVSRTMPQVVREYGKQLWLDPGEPEAASHSLAVILDVVRRYDVDGVHFDDYFYPYPIKNKAGKNVSFPDDRSWQRAQAAGETLQRDDWRRQNVDQFIERVYQDIKKEKPWVKFGVSPFGIWKPGVPESIKGFNAYASLFADARKWTREGWIDYIAPQLYWEVESKGQSYPVLLEWWHEQNRKDRHLWPGNFTSRVGTKNRRWKSAEIIHQIDATRGQSGATGNIHFSMQAIMGNKGGIADALVGGPYAEPSLVPASPWLGDEEPPLPILRKQGPPENPSITLLLAGDKRPWLWAIRTRTADNWKLIIVPGHKTGHTFAEGESSVPPEIIVVSAVSRTGVEGPAAILE